MNGRHQTVAPGLIFVLAFPRVRLYVCFIAGI